MKNKTIQLVIAILFSAIYSSAQVYGTFTDKRDGKTYKTVTIGKKTWLAENLAFKTKEGCWAYDNDNSNVQKYGYLYNLESAKAAIPSGWHLPTFGEWDTLFINLGGDSLALFKIKDTSLWKTKKNNTNESGFSARLAGMYFFNGEEFRDLDDKCYWWSSKIYSSTSALCWYIEKYGDLIKNKIYDVSAGMSVRCVKD